MINQHENTNSEPPLLTHEEALAPHQTAGPEDARLDSTAPLPAVGSERSIVEHHLAGERPGIVVRVGEEDFTEPEYHAYKQEQHEKHSALWRALGRRATAVVASVAAFGVALTGASIALSGDNAETSRAVPAISEPQPETTNPNRLVDLPEAAPSFTQPTAETNTPEPTPVQAPEELTPISPSPVEEIPPAVTPQEEAPVTATPPAAEENNGGTNPAPDEIHEPLPEEIPEPPEVPQPETPEDEVTSPDDTVPKPL